MTVPAARKQSLFWVARQSATLGKSLRENYTSGGSTGCHYKVYLSGWGRESWPRQQILAEITGFLGVILRE